MAIIPQGISQLSEAVLSYVITALTILAVVKFVQMFTGVGGIGGLFKGGGSKDPGTKTRDPPGTREPGPDGKTPKPEKTPGVKTAERVDKDHFDPYNPGQVKFLVCDEDDNPIQGANITVRPKYARRSRYRLLPSGLTPNKDTWRIYTLRTNADGFAPSRDGHEAIGSGVVTIEVDARGFILPKHNYQPSVEIKANQEQLIIITMQGRGEKDTLFEPIIRDVSPKNEKEAQATGEVV